MVFHCVREKEKYVNKVAHKRLESTRVGPGLSHLTIVRSFPKNLSYARRDKYFYFIHPLYSITYYKQLWFLVLATSTHNSHQCKIIIANSGEHVMNNL